MQRSIYDAVVRQGGEGSTPDGGSLCLEPDDFELVEAEQRTETATALLPDLSFSMPIREDLAHTKEMALALHALIGDRHVVRDFVARRER